MFFWLFLGFGGVLWLLLGLVWYCVATVQLLFCLSGVVRGEGVCSAVWWFFSGGRVFFRFIILHFFKF